MQGVLELRTDVIDSMKIEQHYRPFLPRLRHLEVEQIQAVVVLGTGVTGLPRFRWSVLPRLRPRHMYQV